MSACYRCDTELNDTNCSEEHIIPNALGGRLTSKHILCIKCNSEFGSTLDNILSGKINLPTILNIKRDRGEVRDIVGRTSSGIKYLIDKYLIPKNEKIISYINTEGKRAIIVRDENEARVILKQIKNKNPKIDIDEEIKKIKWKKKYINEPLFFANDILDGKETFRAITKIAVSYYCHCLNDTWNIFHLLPFLNNEADKYIVYHYFPAVKIFNPSNSEISHILYLKGDKQEKLLFCYLELFNCHNFLVILNDNYRGFNFVEKYGFNLMDEVEIVPHIELRISKEQLSGMISPGPEDAQNRFLNRLKDVYKIKGLELIQKARDKTI
jgi:hypothetical protein